MTLLLERAYARIVQLPEPEQDRIALKLLEELEHEEHAPRLFHVGSPRLVYPEDAAHLVKEVVIEEDDESLRSCSLFASCACGRGALDLAR